MSSKRMRRVHRPLSLLGQVAAGLRLQRSERISASKLALRSVNEWCLKTCMSKLGSSESLPEIGAQEPGIDEAGSEFDRLVIGDLGEEFVPGA